MTGRFRFGDFLLDGRDRQLTGADGPVAVNARYLDALILLVEARGGLVSKDRFMAEVWRGVPVTDEALTQCIRTLRRLLGDDAARPRFIETVPKHGYRFVAPVTVDAEEPAPAAPAVPAARSWREVLLLGGAGTIGAGVAGAVGGLAYGFAGAAQGGAAAISVLLVLVWITLLTALVGGAGVAFGIALAGRPSPWSIAGGAAGGLIIGGLVKLLGLDAFELLLGHAPGDITGAAEGLALGGAVGLGAWLAGTRSSLRRGAAFAALAGGAGGLLIPALGGRLMAGSLDLLARSFPASRFRLDPIGALLGEPDFGPVSRIVTGGLEGALFGACIVGAMILARRGLARA